MQLARLVLSAPSGQVRVDNCREYQMTKAPLCFEFEGIVNLGAGSCYFYSIETEFLSSEIELCYSYFDWKCLIGSRKVLTLYKIMGALLDVSGKMRPYAPTLTANG